MSGMPYLALSSVKPKLGITVAFGTAYRSIPHLWIGYAAFGRTPSSVCSRIRGLCEGLLMEWNHTVDRELT